MSGAGGQEVDWRGWTAAGSGFQQTVTSGRLAPASVQHRLFPKTRSWFTLGAPLELLSPLSVLRILFGLAVVLWPLVGMAAGIPAPAALAVLVVTGLYGVLWFCLLRLAVAGPRTCEVLVAVLVIGPAAVVHRSEGSFGLAVTYLAFASAVALFAGLFFGVRGLCRYHALALAATWVALVPLTGFVAGGLIAMASGVVALALTTTVRLLCRSAREQNTLDADTGLPNGFGLAKRIGAKSEECFVVAVVHLGGLSGAREALGYPAGTELVRRAVENVGQVIPQGMVGRVEGDEVVVVLPLDAGDDRTADDPPADASSAAARLGGHLVSAIAGGRYMVGGIEITLRAHVGAAIAPWDGHDVVELIRRASLSARLACQQGRSYRMDGGDTDALTTSDLALLSELGQAAARGELRLAYQPQVVPATSKIASVEALLRWDSREHGPVGPAMFIPLAERTGLISRLTDWVLPEALAAARRWADAGHSLAVSVNLSAADLTREGLADWVLRELSAHEVAPERLTLEVTETAATADLFQAIDALRPVRAHGVRIAIDDFGSGYTSLSVLPRLPLDELKLDQRFVLNCLTSPADDAIVESVCDLGHRLGLDVVAEGVEDNECAAHLASLGFDLLQGYALAKPLNETELIDLLEKGGTLDPMGGTDHLPAVPSDLTAASEG